jgi:hypothetical protein
MADRAHFYQSIDGWFDFGDLYRQWVDQLTDGCHIVEVGAFKGKSTAFLATEIANSGKRIQFDTIDTWQGSPEHADDPDVREGRLYETFLSNIAPVADYVRPRRLPSVEAAQTYPDGSLDAVFLDGDHSTQAVVDDCQAWWPKLKPGGVLAGHDRDWPTVARGAKACEQLFGVKLHPVSSRSWLMQKPVPVDDWSVPEEERALVVAVCSNERSIYRQTVQSLFRNFFGRRVTEALQAHGWQDAEPLWVDQFPSVAAQRDYAMMAAATMGASHVLFLDADMTWTKDATLLARMLAHHSAGIVSGVYHLKTWPYWPVVFRDPFIEDDRYIAPRVEAWQQEVAALRAAGRPEEAARLEAKPPRAAYTVGYHYCRDEVEGDDLFPVSMIGMGCALVPVQVIRHLPRPWFEYMPGRDGLPSVTEDVAFCARARAIGCPILVDPTIKCGHIGQQEITLPWYQRAGVEMRLLETADDGPRPDEADEDAAAQARARKALLEEEARLAAQAIRRETRGSAA